MYAEMLIILFLFAYCCFFVFHGMELQNFKSLYSFLLDQHAELDFYSAISLKHQSTRLGHIILILRQPVFAVTP